MKRLILASLGASLLAVTSAGHAFDVKKVFFRAPANVLCKAGASTNFSVRVTHDGCLMQSEIDAGKISVDVVDSDTFADDELDSQSHNLPGGFAKGDRYRFTTKHDLSCTPKESCEIKGPSGGSGESEVELRTEYGDDTDNHGCATVLCTCGDAAAGHLEFVSTLETAPGRIQTYRGGELYYSLRLRAGDLPLSRGSFIRTTLLSSETRQAFELADLDDFPLPVLERHEVGAMCADAQIPLELAAGKYVLVHELIDVTGRVIEEDFTEVDIVEAPAKPDDTAVSAPSPKR